VILSELNDLELDFYNFFKENRTFNGWALSLTASQFNDLMVDFTLIRGKVNMLPPKYKILEFIIDGKHQFEHEEFKDDLVVKGLNLRKISLCRRGFMTYTPAETDDEWTFKITPLGQEKLDEKTKKSL
tara:strand:+ start:344 stop:727 length:384 start_codon:yes stop_codon:yes gene_type:complete